MPLAVGGGISSLNQAREVFNAGADKITLNTSALKRPELIEEIAEQYESTFRQDMEDAMNSVIAAP